MYRLDQGGQGSQHHIGPACSNSSYLGRYKWIRRHKPLSAGCLLSLLGRAWFLGKWIIEGGRLEKAGDNRVRCRMKAKLGYQPIPQGAPQLHPSWFCLGKMGFLLYHQPRTGHLLSVVWEASDLPDRQLLLRRGRWEPLAANTHSTGVVSLRWGGPGQASVVITSRHQ